MPQEAFGGFRRLVHFHGERAPGPGAALHLWVAPGPAVVLGLAIGWMDLLFNMILVNGVARLSR